MERWNERTISVIGEEGVDSLKRATVAVVGLGGVGSYVAEALARAGVGHLILIDRDTVAESNRNRQLVALRSTMGLFKTEVMKGRIADICDTIVVDACATMLDNGNVASLLHSADAIADAVDDVPAKVTMAHYAQREGKLIVSSMGTGNKRQPDRFRVMDITETSVCPLAKKMRKLLKDAGVAHLPVVCSDEAPIRHAGGKVGSLSFVPPVAGMILAGEIVQRILGLR